MEENPTISIQKQVLNEFPIEFPKNIAKGFTQDCTYDFLESIRKDYNYQTFKRIILYCLDKNSEKKDFG